MSLSDLEREIRQIKSEQYNKADEYKLDRLRQEMHSLETSILRETRGEVSFLKELVQRLEDRVQSLEFAAEKT